MALEISGKLFAKLALQTGTSARTGSQWQKQEFVIETEDQYPKKICSSLWGDKVDQLAQFNIGDPIKISVDIESREYQGRWYTDIRAWKIEHPQAVAPVAVAPYPQGAPVQAPYVQQAPQQYYTGAPQQAPQQYYSGAPQQAPQQPSNIPSAQLPEMESTFTDDSPNDLPF